MHGEIPECTVLGGVHPVGAQNKTLISDTACRTITVDSTPIEQLPLSNYLPGQLPLGRSTPRTVTPEDNSPTGRTVTPEDN